FLEVVQFKVITKKMPGFVVSIADDLVERAEASLAKVKTHAATAFSAPL
ncbi:MAG: hypothetical protein ACI9HY_004486, partial [Planctomycetaceae bacterium]